MSIFYRNTLDARIRRTLSALRHCLYVDVNPDHRATTFVVGSPRSGTNWVAELINFDHANRFMNEPFNRERVPIRRPFSRLPYLRPEEDDVDYLAVARSAFEGRMRSAWVDAINQRLVARSRIVKDVRATLMLGWIARRFPGMKTVYLMRHPCAVAHSRDDLGWRIRRREVYFSQAALMRDHLEPFRDLLAAPKPAFEDHVLDWCVENYVPMRQGVFATTYVAFHESLSAQRHEEFRRLFAYLGRGLDDRVIPMSWKPSVTTFIGTHAAHRQAPHPGRWRSARTPDEIERAMAIVRRFGLDRFYVEDVMPVQRSGMLDAAPAVIATGVDAPSPVVEQRGLDVASNEKRLTSA